MQDDIRLGRLLEEFELMKALLKPHALVEFWVADLTAEEAPQFLRTKFSFDVITDGFPGFLTPEQFEVAVARRAAGKVYDPVQLQGAVAA